MDAVFLMGRMLFGGVFLQAGLNHLRNSKSVMLGAKPRLGIASLVGFLELASATMHEFLERRTSGGEATGHDPLQQEHRAARGGTGVASARIALAVSVGRYLD